jgi:hypothetical protein
LDFVGFSKLAVTKKKRKRKYINAEDTRVPAELLVENGMEIGR